LIGIVTFAFQNELINPKIFLKALIASGISFLFGIGLEVTELFNLQRGLTLLYMSVSLIYLFYFKLFLVLFIKWKGTYPIITSSSSATGGKPIEGFWVKYPRDRKITSADFIFSFAQSLVPIFTIMGLAILIFELNR